MLDEQELLDQVILLYVAGHETTVNLIGNGTLALLRHRDQLDRLRDDPELDQNAVEELLRFDSPVQFSRRIAVRDFELHGRTIEAGSFVLTCLGSANHDPQRWGDTADELDLGRVGAAQHVSFGSGVHHCLGASLARVEARAAFAALARRFPGLKSIDEHPPWNGRIVLRGLDALPLAYGRASEDQAGLTLTVTVLPSSDERAGDGGLHPDPSRARRVAGGRLGLDRDGHLEAGGPQRRSRPDPRSRRARWGRRRTSGARRTR